MLAVASFDGYFLRLNPAWSRKLGFDLEELMARPYTELIHPDDRSASANLANRLRGGARVATFENRFRGKDGSYRRLTWSAHAASTHAQIYLVARDVTQARQTEVELRRLSADLEAAKVGLQEAGQLKSRFLANVSHELRTPLNSIMGFAELLIAHADDYDKTTRLRFLDTIHLSGMHLLNLINDILDLAKVEAGRMELQPRRVDISETIEEVVRAVLPLAEKKRIALVTSEVLAGSLVADQGRVKQILFNLLSNAIKFTGHEGTVRVEARRLQRQMELVVTDTGIGIAASDHQRIFEEFQQVDGGSDRHYTGTGLGLTLTKHLTQLHGGSIEVESALGAGSRFTVRLPLEPPSGAPSLGDQKPFVP